MRQFIPFIKIIDIHSSNKKWDETQIHDYSEEQRMGLVVNYYIPNLNLSDTLKVTVTST